MVSPAEAFGLAGGFFIALGLVPQVLRVWRMKDAKEISLTFVVLTMTGTALWLVYGVLLGLLSVMLWNGVNLVLQSALLAVKLMYGMNLKSNVPVAHVGRG